MTTPTTCPARSATPAHVLALSISLNIILAAGWIMCPTFTLLNLQKLTGLHHKARLSIELSTQAQTQQPAPGWSQRAAEAAEAAALFNCSGNGDLYIDTIGDAADSIRFMASLSSDAAVSLHQSAGLSCECYECFVGPNCADRLPDCDANVESGDPLLFAPFWKQNAKESAILIPGWYRMGYDVIEASSDQAHTPALEREIRALHTLVGNAVVDNKYILIGFGTTLLLNAALASLSPTSGKPASVVSATPHYQAYRSQTLYFENSHFVWAGDANMYATQEITMNESSIEFVNTPNNPDSSIRVAVLNGSSASTIYDLVYYWPHFTAITASLDHDVMLFSLSKITGHAGSRLGWAIVKDFFVYTRMLEHVKSSVMTIAHESQLRATQILSSINKAYSKQLALRQKVPLGLEPSYYATKGLSFHFAYAVLRDRWRKLSSTLESSQQLGLQEVNTSYCSFFEAMLDPSPAYAWVHCKNGNEEECQSLITEAGILARNGTTYGASSCYTRFSLLKRDTVFENLVQRLATIVSKETGDMSLYHNVI